MGDVLEIGVYQGKTAAFLGMLCAETERLLACDMFENPPHAPDYAEREWYLNNDRDADGGMALGEQQFLARAYR